MFAQYDSVNNMELRWWFSAVLLIKILLMSVLADFVLWMLYGHLFQMSDEGLTEIRTSFENNELRASHLYKE